MNYYTIKSTEPEGYVLDKTKLVFPAHVMDLRSGLTYVLENNTDEAIVVGGKIPPKQVLAIMYVLVAYGEGIYFSESMTPAEMADESEWPDFTHIAIKLLDEEGELNMNSSEDLIDAFNPSNWDLLPLMSDAVEPAPEQD